MYQVAALICHPFANICYLSMFTSEFPSGCTPLINRVRHHLASQCFEVDNLAAIPCLSKFQKKMLKMELMHLFFMLDVLYC